MAEPFIGEIKMFAGTFAPRNWAFCDGQLLSVSGSDALFSLLGTIYGGDGRTTFGLPDFRGRLPLHMGTGAGLTPRPIGQRAGFERVTLTGNQLPSHGHTLNATNETADSQAAAGLLRGQTTDDTYSTIDSTLTMPASSTSAAGGSQSHDNVQPFLCINFIIALVGIYPSRS
jgi:microcystin-dependent protein